MTPVLVREYKSEDREAVERCFFELQEDEYNREPHYWGKPQDVAHPYVDYVLKTIDKSDGKIFVIEEEGLVAGLVVVLISEKEDSPAVSLEQFGYVMDLVVLRKYQGKGLGSALMSRAEEYIKDKGLKWMQLDVSKGNPALDFYLRAGYKEKSTRLEKKLF